MKPSWPFHALLLPVFPVLALYLENRHEMVLGDLLHPLVFVLILSLVVLAILGLLLRDARAGILVSLLFVWSFSYQILVDTLGWLLRTVHLGSLVMDKVFFPLWAIALLACAVALLRTRRDLRPSSRVMNLASLLLVTFCLIRIAGSATGGQRPREDLSAAPPDESSGTSPDLALTLPPDPPDIYFLLFDRYPSASALRDYFDYDNGAFVAALRDLGFQVCDSAMANYPMTHLSLACTLGMDYLGDQYLGQIHYRPMIQRSRVALALRKIGYRYVHLGSWYEATRRNPLADENLNYSLLLSEFSKALLRTTPYHLFLLRDEKYRQALYTLWNLERLPRTRGPKFVFAHLLIPHPPHVIDADGSALPPGEASRRTEEENYLNQILFLNSRLPRLLHTLIIESERPPVILLQSDEGPLIFGRQQELSQTEKRRIRAGILLASYFPGSESPGHAWFTPVNSFRLVFNRYFGTDLELREDRVFYWPEVLPNGHPLREDQPFPFLDVTDDVRGYPLPAGTSRN